MDGRRPPVHRRRNGFWVALIATIIGGVVLAVLLPRLLGSELTLVNTTLYAQKDEYSVFGVKVHNDGSVSVGNCYATLTAVYDSGGRATLPASTSAFYLPANSDGVNVDGSAGSINFS